MIQEVINMAIHNDFYIYAGLTILALALSIGIFTWFNGVRPDMFSVPFSTALINMIA